MHANYDSFMPHVSLSKSRGIVETSKQDERVPRVVWLSLFPISGGSVFAIALVLRAEGPADVASAGTLLPLPRPPGQHVAPQQFGGVWCWTADCQVKKYASLYIRTYMWLAWLIIQSGAESIHDSLQDINQTEPITNAKAPNTLIFWIVNQYCLCQANILLHQFSLFFILQNVLSDE